MNPRGRILDRPPAAWDALVRDDRAAGPSQRAAAWDAFAAAVPGGEVCFLAAEASGTLVGGAGVVIERRAGFAWLHAMPWLLGGAPLAGDGPRPEVDAAVAEAFAALARERRAVGGEWAWYRPGADPSGAEEALGRVPGMTTRVTTAVVDTAEGIDAVRARAGRRMRQYLRHAHDGFAFAEEPEALDEVYVLHVRQARGWSGFAPLPLELSRRLLAAGDAPLARLFTLRRAGRLLAGTLFLDHPREMFAWWSGIAPEARGHHLYPLLLWRAIERAADLGRARVNLGGSAGKGSLVAFKEALGARDLAYPVRWLSAAHATPAGRAVAAFQDRLRRGRARGERA